MLDRHDEIAIEFGGAYVPETAVAYMDELAQVFAQCQSSSSFASRRDALFNNFAGRPSPLLHASRLSQHLGGANIYIKREDSGCGLSHHMLSAITQVLLAQRMGRTRIMTNTGSGFAGVAVAAASKQIGDFKCVVYMGENDVKRNPLCVQKMKYLDADVVQVSMGAGGFREAVSGAMQDWVSNIIDTFYVLCPPIGPDPYPKIVQWAQLTLGQECQRQFKLFSDTHPNTVIASVDGGGGAVGMFSAYIPFPEVRLIGVQAGGEHGGSGDGAAPITHGSPGLYHGYYSCVLQDHDGQVPPVSSIAPGLAYPAVGPAHARWHETGRAEYTFVINSEALSAARLLARYEGISVSLEGAHALAAAFKEAQNLSQQENIIVGPITGGDKDLSVLMEGEA